MDMHNFISEVVGIQLSIWKGHKTFSLKAIEVVGKNWNIYLFLKADEMNT